MNVRSWFSSRLSSGNAKILVCVLALIIATVDFALPANIDVASLYFICVVLLVSTHSVKWLWSSTVIFIFFTFGGITLAPAAVVNAVTWVDWLNRTMTALALAVAAVPVHLRVRSIMALERATAERDRAERELQASHAALEARVRQRTRDLQAEIDERARTELKLRESEKSLRQLSLQLISAQDEERRRIARELHDSVGQYLAHSKLNLDSWLRNPRTDGPGLQSICETAESLDKCASETRNMSYLLHPPLLDMFGFSSAAKEYTDGFSRRSGIHVHLDIPPELRRLRSDVELVLFRVLQEGLTNVLHYAHSPSVDIHVECDLNQVALVVRDYGHGMPRELVDRLNTRGEGGGVGLRGMRERILEFQGDFHIESNEKGTSIRAVLPIIEVAKAVGSE